MIEKGGKPTLAVSLGTFAISAFWHGFYPFYYVMFFMSALFVELAKEVYRCRILLSFIPEGLRHPLANIGCMIVLNYFGTSFNALTFERGFTFGSGVNHFVFILIPIVLFLVKSLGLVKKAKKMEEALKKKKEEKETKKDK
jgi:lysophospholipid acyltransferase